MLPRPVPRSASAGSVRVANQAGAAPKMMPVISASAKAKARTTERRRSADGKKMRAVEGEREQQARGSDGDYKSGNAAGDREQDAFG